jgi:SAM-dependent methyltransferase
MKEPNEVLSPVWVYPVDGFVVVSDRRDDPEGGEYTPAEDVVFPAIYAGTLRFLRLLPEATGGEALDHCGGSGIGALHLARTARTAATADLTERSAFFARFNGRLNDVNIESLCGDLYGPVAGRQFDLITAHPPFVPATGDNMVYRDGGATGEEVTQRLIEGLPVHLRPGGTCVILCVARDTAEKTFEQRVLEWLGEARAEFDVIFGLEKVLAVEGVIESMRKRGQQISETEAKELYVRLRSLGTRQFVYGALFLRRCREGARQKPFRIGLTTEGCAADFERLFAWRRFARQPGFAEWLPDSRPRFASRLQLTARHVVQEGELVPAEFVFQIEDGLEAALRPDAWVVPLLARLNGNRSVRQVFESAQQADELPAGFRLEDFSGLVANLLERGFLQVDFQN